ncbi:MAG TPA: glycerophosphodiester phosphodiesterase family protein [Sunxiuqinia sp.]|nr:glycerophosphodiester phosphodiesterase family protein [Sunxiuqinia sp.]
MKLIKATFLLTIWAIALASCAQPNQKTKVEATNQPSSSEKILAHLHAKSNNYVFVTAHRGDWRNAPENSIQALKNCIAMGIDVVETDVHLTKDSVLVIMHDNTIDRTTTGTGKVSDYTYDELEKFFLKAGQGHATYQHIPSFEDFMLAAKGNILVNVDKGWDCLDKVVAVLKKTGTLQQALIKGIHPYDEVRRDYGSLIDEIQYIPIVSGETPNMSSYVDDFIQNSKPAAFEVIFKTNDSPVDSQLQKMKQQGVPIWINSLWDDLCAGHDDELALSDPDANWGWILKKGATFIQTDRPKLMLNYLRKKGLHD